MEDIRETIGANIRTLRKQKGQSLQSLSKQVGITHQQLSRIENGSGTTNATLQRIAQLLDVDIPTLMDEPECTLQRILPQTKNFISDQLCNQMYARIYDEVIKVTNDAAIDKFMVEVTEKLVKNKAKIRNFMCTHAGDKEIYTFTPSALLDFCQLLYVDFADHAMRISKTDYTGTDDPTEQE